MGFMDLFKPKKASGNEAKRRLQLCLQSDRAGCSPEIMEKMKADIISVISKYIEIDTEGLDIKVDHNGEEGSEDGPSIYASIPIKGVKRIDS
jgi:cell division topological specificity factor